MLSSRTEPRGRVETAAPPPQAVPRARRFPVALALSSLALLVAACSTTPPVPPSDTAAADPSHAPSAVARSTVAPAEFTAAPTPRVEQGKATAVPASTVATLFGIVKADATPTAAAPPARPSIAARTTPMAVAVPPTVTTVPQPPPPPPPTPTPRVKAAPSQYKRLQDYPRPANDSGYGFHINAQPFFIAEDILRAQVIPLLKALGATWVTVWASSYAEDQVRPARLMVESGFEVVLRFHDLPPPHPDYVPDEEGLRRFRAAGIRYFVTGNEPNLKGENPSHAGAESIARQWVVAADRVKDAGGIPLMYPMSPGGGRDVADSRAMLTGILDWLRANDALDTLDGAGVAIHNRPLGKPLEVQDSNSFLEYEWIDDTVTRYAGKHLPLLGTEAGYAFGEQVLPEYPRIDGELHKRYNMAIITGFRDGRWRDSLFTQNFWILSGFGHQQFVSDWWVASPLNFAQDLPIVDALKALPKFERKFSEQGFR